MNIRLDERGAIEEAVGKFLAAILWGVIGAVFGALFVLGDALSAKSKEIPNVGDLILFRGIMWGFPAGFIFYYLITTVLDHYFPKKAKVDLDSMLFKSSNIVRTTEEIMSLPEFKELSEQERKILLEKWKFLQPKQEQSK